MSEAKEKYLQFKNHADYNGLEPEITDYVAALELRNAEIEKLSISRWKIISELQQDIQTLRGLLERSKKIMSEHNLKGFSIIRDINKYFKKGL